MRIFRKIAQLLDVDLTSTPPSDGDALTFDAGSEKWIPGAGGGGGGVTDADYLVGTANPGLSAEIVVGTAPGGELGGTWASPTVDAVHSGSSHATVQAAAEATAAAALSAHSADTTGVHGIADTSALLDTGDIGSTVADVTHVHAGEDITTGTVADARIASTIARDSEVTSAISALSSVYQPLDSDLTAVAALSTTSFGRSLLTLADAAALLSTAGAQASDSDLTAIAALSPTNDDIVQRKAGAWTNRTMAQLLADLAAVGTTFQPLDSDLTSIAALTTNAAGRGLLTLADPNADRILFWDDSAGAYTHLTPGTNLTITGTTIDASGGSSPSIVTSLPGSPSNGDEVYLKVGSGDTAVLWHMRYDSSITDSYKWRFLGGAPIQSLQATRTNRNNGTFGTLDSSTPKVTVPTIGIYTIDHSAIQDGNGGTGYGLIGLQINGSAITNDDASDRGLVGTIYAKVQREVSSIGTSADIVQVYRTGADSYFSERRISVTPVRLG